MNKFMIIIALIAILMFISCGDDDYNSDNIDTSKLIDLRVGNKWIYDRIFISFDGKADTIQTIYEISKSYKFNSETIYMYNKIFDTIGFHYCERNDGFYLFDNFNETFRIAYKYPFNIGETYIDSDGISMKVISKNNMLFINNKYYNTIHYQTKIINEVETIIIDEYFEPGTGLIKLIDTWDNIGFESPIIWVLELKSFTLGKK